MAQFQINCVKKDDNGVILEVGILNGKIYSIFTVVNHMKQRPDDDFFVYENNIPVKVYAKQNTTSGNWYLTTLPDSTVENNLDFLPSC
ncbi:MAG: DUF3892 domain-containing protein [Candidatus Nitrosocosmicus sp.]